MNRLVASPVVRAAALLVTATLLAYANSFAGAFVFDDRGAILENATIRRLWPLSEVLSPPNAGLPVTGRPLTNLSLALNYAVHGSRPLGYHLVNVAIHLANALLLLGVIRRSLEHPRLGGRFGPAAVPLASAAALLWAVHPLQTGAVTYISQRAESLGTLFILVALYGFVRAIVRTNDSVLPGGASPATLSRPSVPGAADRASTATGDRRPARAWLALSALACWLGVASKEIAYAIPLLVLAYDVTFTDAFWRERLRARGWYYLALVLSWVPLTGLIASTANRGGTWATDAGFTAWSYALVQCEALGHYLRLVFWPAPLVFDYGRNLAVPPWTDVWPQALLLLALAAATLVGLWRRAPAAVAGVVFFAILAPTSSFVPIADAIFEHRMYLPSAAVIVFVVLLVYRWAGRRAGWAILPVALALGGATMARNSDYRSPVALWRDTVAKRPDNARAQGNLGDALVAAGQVAEALPHFESAYRLTPHLPLSAHNLANALDLLGRREEAVRYYREALRLQPRNFLAATNLGNALAETGALDEALALLDTTVRDVPEFAEARQAYGRALLRARRTEDAIAQFRRAVELRPRDADYHFNLGDALARARRLDEAIVALREAVRLRPDHAAALNNLGNALLLTRQVPDAIATFEAALRARPDAVTHTNLGLALAIAGRREEAIVQLEAALRLNPQHAPARSTLERLRR